MTLYYLVSFSRGAGALPLPEREVSSQNPFSFILHHLRRRKMKTNEVVLVRGTGNASTLFSQKDKPKNVKCFIKQSYFRHDILCTDYMSDGPGTRKGHQYIWQCSGTLSGGLGPCLGGR